MKENAYKRLETLRIHWYRRGHRTLVVIFRNSEMHSRKCEHETLVCVSLEETARGKTGSPCFAGLGTAAQARWHASPNPEADIWPKPADCGECAP